MFFFFFSSRRRHTRSLRDWSSDVCSSDLHFRAGEEVFRTCIMGLEIGMGRRSEERRVGKSVDLGGRRIIKKKKKNKNKGRQQRNNEHKNKQTDNQKHGQE